MEEILRSVYAVATAGPYGISQTVPSPSSGNLQSEGPGIISQTVSSSSAGNLQALVEQIFQLDRIAWQPDTFLERVGLKLEQKYFSKIICGIIFRESRRFCFVMLCLEMIGFVIFLSYGQSFTNTCSSLFKYTNLQQFKTLP